MNAGVVPTIEAQASTMDLYNNNNGSII